MSREKKVLFNWAELMPKIEAVPLASLNPYKNNPRYNSKSIPVVKKSVKRYGFLVPIVINNTTDLEIAAGHTRLAASLELCKDEGRDPKTVKVPCILAEHLTPEQIRQFRVVDNQAASLSNWDWGKLNEEFAAMPDVDWADFGFTTEKKETEKLSDVDARFVYKPERAVQDNDTSAFVGIMNEGYFTASIGYGVVLQQTSSATQSGGLTDNYRENKLLNKSLVCPIQFPSAIYANFQRSNGGRLHHIINNKYLMPRVMKVGEKDRSNIAWDTYPEDVVFRNDRRNEIVIDDE